MPGFHTKKQKRQAKHIIAGYKKRGVDSDTAKHIAWATVNKQKSQHEDWQFNGAGQPVFIGNNVVSQFDPSGTVSPGQPYLPDEVAKMLVKESGLRKMDTVPKRVIVRYLESMGLSAGLAVDVAKVLRDVYGIQPIFDEETLLGRSGALIEELTKTMDENFPMPFIDMDSEEPRELTEVEIIGSFIQHEFLESGSENYDLVLAHLAMMSPGDFRNVVAFYEAVGPEMFDYLEGLVADGQADIAEHVLNGICFPAAIKFMPEHVQALFDEDAADDVIKAGTAKMRAKMPKIPPIPKGGPKPAAAAAPKKPGMAIPKIKKQAPAVPGFRKQMKMHAKDKFGGSTDTLAAKKPGSAMATHRAAQDKEWADKLAAAKTRHADEPAKSVPKPGIGSALKKAGKAAIGVMKKVHSSFTKPKESDGADHDSKISDSLKKIGKGALGVGKTIAKGIGKAAVHTAAGAAGAAGHVVGAAARGTLKGLTGSGGKSDAAPKEKKGLLGHLGHAIGRFAGQVKKGYHSNFPGVAHVAGGGSSEKTAEEPKKKERVATSPAGKEAATESSALIDELGSMFMEDYPELGKTPYGPAGDPKRGPQLAKDWMTPQPAGSMEPHGGETTRMFSDPEEREKARKAKLADVMQALDSMRQQAAVAGVPPEGMFLNLYRDMHREKVRYS